MSDYDYCDDCGLMLSEGICSNCQEELAILTFQHEDIDFELPQEFLDAAAEQQKQVDARKRVAR